MTLIIAAAQSTSIAGGIESNVASHLRFGTIAAEHGAQLVVFPELSLTGYEPDIARSSAICPEALVLGSLRCLAQEAHMTLVVGAPILNDNDKLHIARDLDPSGDYRMVPGDNLTEFDSETFDLIVSLFTFDNVPSAAKVVIFSDLRTLLRPAGTIVSVVSSPDIYTHEWASFTTKDFPENAAARSGDVVRIVVTDHQDRRPVEDILWTDESYREVYRQASLQAIQVFKPLAKTWSASKLNMRKLISLWTRFPSRACAA